MEAATSAKGDAAGLACLMDVFADNQRHADVVRVARRWLVAHPDPRGLDGVAVRQYLSVSLRKLGKNQEAIAAIEPAAGSGQGGAMHEAARIYAAMGKAEKARAMAARGSERYPGANSTAGRAEIEWLLGEPSKAASILREAKLRALDYQNIVAPAFARVFVQGMAPGAEAAFSEILKAGLDPAASIEIIDAVGKSNAKLAVAFMEQLTQPIARMETAVRNFEILRTAKGDKAAVAWARERMRGGAAHAAGIMSERQEEPLWLLDEPGQGEPRDLLWLFRAVAAQWRPPSRHLDALKQHFATPGDARYYKLGRVVMGLEDEAAGIALRGTTPSQACEVAFYLGARAQGLGKLDEANDWYRAAIETSLPGESEYHFALAQMAVWAAQNRSLARIAQDGTF
jgi:tetratricopeptide (TPR) repeat protein